MGRQWTQIELNETFDLHKRKAWFMDGVHTIPRWPAFPLDHVWPNAERGLVWGCQKISHPHCKGWMWRTRDGSAYLSPVMVTDEDEKKKRQGPFREALKPFIEDFHGLWATYKEKWEKIWDEMYAFDVENAADIDLEDFYRKLVQVEIDNWKDHFYIMEGVGSLTLLFEDLAREICGIDSGHPLWGKLCTGFPSRAFKSDAKLHELGQKAVAYGMKDLFLEYSDTELLEQVRKAPNGGAFLKELDAFLDVYGNRLVQLLNFSTPTWKERPDIVLNHIAVFVKMGGGFIQEQAMRQSEKERKDAETEILSKVPNEQKEWFKTLMGCAQNWGWWNEEHEFWLNESTYSLMRRVMLEFGRRFAAAGTFHAAEDIFHIREKDFERVLHHPQDFNLRPEVAKHKGELEEFRKIESQAVVSYDTIEGAVGWLMGMREFHVALSMGYMPEPKEGVNALIWGTCGSPGQAEGTARVITSEDQLQEIQKGDIVVCPTTYVTWTPYFSLMGGLIVDRGGSLSHSAICSREYGIPCIMNTFAGTSTLKTGQKVKINADIGAVFVDE